MRETATRAGQQQRLRDDGARRGSRRSAKVILHAPVAASRESAPASSLPLCLAGSVSCKRNLASFLFHLQPLIMLWHENKRFSLVLPLLRLLSHLLPAISLPLYPSNSPCKTCAGGRPVQVTPITSERRVIAKREREKSIDRQSQVRSG